MDPGGRLILLECPSGLHLGFDYCTWTSSELVKGIKSIDSGPHYLYYTHPETQDKQGLFIYMHHNGVAVRKWKDGELRRMDREDEELFERAGLEGDFDLFLGDFPGSKSVLWRHLTSYISESVLSQVDPGASAQTPNFTIIPHHYSQFGMSPAQITASNFDKTHILLDLLHRERLTWESLLGEFQYSFISLLIGESLPGFEQWKSILVLLLSCENALITHSELYIALIPVLYQQLLQLGDVSMDPYIQTSFIPKLVGDFITLLSDASLPPALYSRGEKLAKLVREMMGELEESEEDAPVVVDLTSEQLANLGEMFEPASREVAGRPPRGRSKGRRLVPLGKILKGVQMDMGQRTMTPRARRQEGSVCSTRSSSSTKPLTHSLSLQIQRKLPPPACSAQAWTLTNGDTGKVLFGVKDTEAREIASLTKITTFYLALQLVKEMKISLNCEVLVSTRASQMDGTSANLQAGDRLRLIDLFYALMLPSGNDAAQCLAEFFGRRLIESRGFSQSIKDTDHIFVREMNTLCVKLHLRKTVFQNPHGMSVPRNLSSARDVGMMASAAMRLQLFRMVVSTGKYTCKVMDRQGLVRVKTWQNTNQLLSRGYEGMKTGVTDIAGPCLCASWTRNSQRLIITVLHSRSMDARWEDVEQILAWALRKD